MQVCSCVEVVNHVVAEVTKTSSLGWLVSSPNDILAQLQVPSIRGVVAVPHFEGGHVVSFASADKTGKRLIASFFSRSGA
jgi:hypothetical protein